MRGIVQADRITGGSNHEECILVDSERKQIPVVIEKALEFLWLSA